MKLSPAYGVALLAAQAAGAAIKHRLNGLTLTEHSDPVKRDLLQEYITWDDKSLFIKGERIMIFSGEFHPYRLPVRELQLDIFQKVKALGFNCVSFYVDWALVEGKPGEYRADGIFDLEPFFDAASEAGIYLLARPGPYINAESSGGGFPGWLQRVNGTLRTSAKSYLDATDNYVANTAATIAKYQITNGGPIILYQPENEYTSSCCGVEFPNADYMQYVEDQARNAGVVIPLINNDASPDGNNAPGTGKGAVNIYGHDSYPLGFDCANPTVWPSGDLPTDFRTLHLEQSPTTPYSIVEFQGGSYDPWGGPGFAACADLLNEEFERVFYKNDFSFQVAIMNLYMIFGGTNWGNVGYPEGYTSYDYGSAITESRNITRTKYSELKLIGNFMKVSPSYLTASPGSLTTSGYADTADLTVTPLLGNGTGSYFVIRHSDYSSEDSTSYTITLPTSAGTLTIPQLGGTLTLNGRDSKIHVADYNVSGTKIIYSTAEVFTWKKFTDSKVLVLYGGSGEHHELSIASRSNVTVVEGSESGITSKQTGSSVVVGWDVSATRRIIQVGDLKVLLLDRESAYNYWVPQLATDGTSPGFSSQETVASSIIVNAGYLVRTAYLKDDGLYLTADFNATTTVEIFGAPSTAQSLYINGDKTTYTIDKNGIWTAEVKYSAPDISIPSLESLEWKYLDTLPEIQSSYDDSLWPAADLAHTWNTFRALDTPTSLYSSDYGFHTGYLLYRGHFVATGNESTFFVDPQGGSAFGFSAWLNGTYLGSWTGLAENSDYNATFTLPSIQAGKSYVITIVIDNLGLEENWTVGEELMKTPRGILNYQLSGRSDSAISWKLTGNLGGEDYEDKVRGPLNEGGLYAERQGFHQPEPPSQDWKSSSPLDGLSEPGIGFYSAQLDLELPTGWDVPLYFNIGNSTTPSPYRVQLYVNGYQYGKYISNVGPQVSFPVPEGILNYRGTNWLAVSLWALDEGGAKLESFELTHTTPVLTALGTVASVDQPKWTAREGAY
ncbi:beta-galactosidase extracellular [Aspergillus heteromorphus CBS 117.55]|uniref:Beta-galactosidase n=1 Tax=Aspergillus heteromorphus CBS 117.55 TaxID=1448321 RepID=A0A317UZ11_9EURO|nr:beta-galactosidase extracellular [Aspergillus heteromorphus CBS 117.55]PWY65732.1 beta-galactosidase extracellular [Aspergillus heteromorphus CBS 117.55]